MAKLGRLTLDYNLGPMMRSHVHGMHFKDIIVLHETVSPDIVGLADILNNSRYLASKDYGIHGLTDKEGHIAWALELGRAVFWQTGGINLRSIGIEQVSRVMLQSPNNIIRRQLWTARTKELRATARLIAAVSKRQGDKIPLRFSDGTQPGVTSHWNVARHYPASEGHTDCHPYHLGGYYPILQVIRMARLYRPLV